MTHTKESILTMLKCPVKQRQGVIERAIIAIYNKQTEYEKNAGDTLEENGVGFSGAHAKIGTYLATWCLQGKRLSGNFRDKGLHIACRYAGQLAKIANKEI